jgi:Ca2+-transporting ATPase
MAKSGLRVLGVAYAEKVVPPFPESPAAFGFTFAGLVGFADPLRPSVPRAVAECREAGIRPIMITGDYPMTARAIAMQAGIAANDVVSGDELEAMNDAQLLTRVRSATVFARIAPHQKLRVVTALKRDGQIVAMTGDGVNDAPSLRAAHIGIAMGSRGTDVAREASSIVLLNDDFASIVQTIRLGRRIYDNLRKAMTYILAVHVPIAGLAILPILLGWPMILLPVHIAFLEMVIDPICAIAFEAEHGGSNVMRRAPRKASAKLISGGLVVWSLLQGGLVLLAVTAIQYLAQLSAASEAAARAETFLALSICNLALILANRSYSASLASALLRANKALWFILGVTASILALAVTWAPAREIFRFAPLDLSAVTLCLAAGAAVLLVLEAAKHVWREHLQG